MKFTIYISFKETKQNKFLVFDKQVLFQKLNIVYNINFSLNHILFCHTGTYHTMEIKYMKEKITRFEICSFNFTKINHMNENIFFKEIYNGKIGYLLPFRKHLEYLWQVYYLINILTLSCCLQCIINIYFSYLGKHWNLTYVKNLKFVFHTFE